LKRGRDGGQSQFSTGYEKGTLLSRELLNSYYPKSIKIPKTVTGKM